MPTPTGLHPPSGRDSVVSARIPVQRPAPPTADPSIHARWERGVGLVLFSADWPTLTDHQRERVAAAVVDAAEAAVFLALGQDAPS